MILVVGATGLLGKGDWPMSLISIDDVAAFAVIGATDPRAANRVIPLGGPQAITPVEVVRIFESVTGKTFRITHVPEVILQIVPMRMTTVEEFCRRAVGA